MTYFEDCVIPGLVDSRGCVVGDRGLARGLAEGIEVSSVGDLLFAKGEKNVMNLELSIAV